MPYTGRVETDAESLITVGLITTVVYSFTFIYLFFIFINSSHTKIFSDKKTLYVTFDHETGKICRKLPNETVNLMALLL